MSNSRTPTLPPVSQVQPGVLTPPTVNPQNFGSPKPQGQSNQGNSTVGSDKNSLSGDAAVVAAVAGGSIVSMTFLPMWIYVALVLVIYLIILWCIRNVAVDAKGASINNTAKYQAVALLSVLLFGIGAGTAYYLHKMCQGDYNPAVMWLIAIASPIALVFLLGYLVQLVLGTFYYTLSYAYGYDSQKEIAAITSANAAATVTNPSSTGTQTPPNVRPGGTTTAN